MSRFDLLSAEDASSVQHYKKLFKDWVTLIGDSNIGSSFDTFRGATASHPKLFFEGSC